MPAYSLGRTLRPLSTGAGLTGRQPSPVAPRFETVSVGERLQAGSSVVQGLPLVDVGLLVQP
eukprot:8111097-Ditylum_brightwellii.AAC.1